MPVHQDTSTTSAALHIPAWPPVEIIAALTGRNWRLDADHPADSPDSPDKAVQMTYLSFGGRDLTHTRHTAFGVTMLSLSITHPDHATLAPDVGRYTEAEVTSCGVLGGCPEHTTTTVTHFVAATNSPSTSPSPASSTVEDWIKLLAAYERHADAVNTADLATCLVFGDCATTTPSPRDITPRPIPA